MTCERPIVLEHVFWVKTGFGIDITGSSGTRCRLRASRPAQLRLQTMRTADYGSRAPTIWSGKALLICRRRKIESTSSASR
ncbi:hypothetical protein I7I53_10505 [Histoplasma capsulatum var. duboisii H88]|uniref:Uncharacterized protein n=1 Tax=Ajellomyces capsulatus (strain H88) TaxID=544711 RepID=A0A8A1LD75_AJEC8|nr:hypothetical protein I7I53_10505 [Histoplasma capsulatum var. duboisii H88]